MPKYEVLSPELVARMALDRQDGAAMRMGYDNASVIRRKSIATDNASIWRPPFAHDIDKILHCPFYNRYTDKTQVFSLIKNDDITRRSLHVQLVSRIARTIGAALGLNLDLIEAIALGHDMGHPPFAHSGESYLCQLYHQHTGRYFFHNVHSVRVLDVMFPYNISLQTLHGIATHNGEVEMMQYEPQPVGSFEEFDRMIERCYTEPGYANTIMPGSLEAIVVRISDIIAYLGKDRQDADRAGVVPESLFFNEDIGSINAEIINNLVVNIIENSYGKSYIGLDKRHFKALVDSKAANYRMIYNYAAPKANLENTAKPMMAEIYGQMLDDLRAGNKNSPIYTHHINYLAKVYYKRSAPYESSEYNQIVVDFIASMTETYFVELHHYLFPDSKLKVEYTGYFDSPNSTFKE